MLLSTHILSEAEAVCSRVLILSHGRLAAEGELTELTAGGRSLEDVFLAAAGPADGEGEV